MTAISTFQRVNPDIFPVGLYQANMLTDVQHAPLPNHDAEFTVNSEEDSVSGVYLTPRTNDISKH